MGFIWKLANSSPFYSPFSSRHRRARLREGGQGVEFDLIIEIEIKPNFPGLKFIRLLLEL
jgi:hypothetical protein